MLKISCYSFSIKQYKCNKKIKDYVQGTIMDSLRTSKRKLFLAVSHLTITGLLIGQHANADDNWKLSLKNAYINRDFDDTAVKDTGSWSQGISLFYNSDYKPTPIDQLEIGLDGSVQYAVRLSDDKHVADTVLPFDTETQSQADDFLKYGATLKLKYNDNVVKVGELWLDLPVTSVDASRQLLASYLGVNFNSKINDKLTLEAGRVTKVSPRNQEGFHKFTYTSNGVKHDSDGLNYIDLRYQFNDNLKAEYYFGNLEDLYDKHYLGLDHQYKISDKLSLLSKFKYFNAQDSGSGLDIDSQNIGLIETLKYDNHSFGIGYQKIVGDAYPIPDGFLPELYFINWNVTGFFKKEEQSYHFIYAYNFKDYIPGLNAIAKYSYGDQIKMDNGKENQESELNLIGSYNFQQPALKGVGLQYLYAKYDVDYGKDFDENRVFLTYTKKF